MLEQATYGQIPDRLRPIYEARTAHQSMRAAIAVVKITPPAEQNKLLLEEAFMNGLKSALAGLDEKPEIHKNELLGAFDKNVRQIAKELIFSPQD